jgi:hypothetical protein
VRAVPICGRRSPVYFAAAVLRWINVTLREKPHGSPTFTSEGGTMTRLAGLLILLTLAVALFMANDGGALSFIGTLMAVAGIVGFAIFATGLTVGHDISD